MSIFVHSCIEIHRDLLLYVSISHKHSLCILSISTNFFFQDIFYDMSLVLSGIYSEMSTQHTRPEWNKCVRSEDTLLSSHFVVFFKPLSFLPQIVSDCTCGAERVCVFYKRRRRCNEPHTSDSLQQQWCDCSLSRLLCDLKPHVSRRHVTLIWLRWEKSYIVPISCTSSVCTECVCLTVS